jgi:hypothetical protein
LLAAVRNEMPAWEVWKTARRNLQRRVCPWFRILGLVVGFGVEQAVWFRGIGEAGQPAMSWQAAAHRHPNQLESPRPMFPGQPQPSDRRRPPCLPQPSCPLFPGLRKRGRCQSWILGKQERKDPWRQTVLFYPTSDPGDPYPGQRAVSSAGLAWAVMQCPEKLFARRIGLLSALPRESTTPPARHLRQAFNQTSTSCKVQPGWSNAPIHLHGFARMVPRSYPWQVGRLS